MGKELPLLLRGPYKFSLLRPWQDPADGFQVEPTQECTAGAVKDLRHCQQATSWEWAQGILKPKQLGET